VPPDIPNPFDPAYNRIWDDWNDDFLAQPLPMQLAAAESSLRQLLRRFRRLCAQLPDGPSKRELSVVMIEIEEEINLIEEIGHHARVEIVTMSATANTHPRFNGTGSPAMDTD
jgi:hypothetical protein